ncbi:MAG TPA: PA0069 family radical SAM protein [Arachidicoccus sp.]
MSGVDDYKKGRGAQFNPHNQYLKDEYKKEFPEVIDDWEDEDSKTTFLYGDAKTLVNKVDSPDVGMSYSANPYQGCEHGCIYCYARNSHQYWGFSAGLDFERKIVVKKNAPELFKKFIAKKGWDAHTISVSGNTDCYQPAERKFKLTRQILEIALQYRQPIGMITKNSLVIRDADILSDMAKLNLCCVFVSINSLNENLRSKMEPRTTTAKQRLKIVETLAKQNIPVGVMIAPIIPGLNDSEISSVVKIISEHGAKFAGYTVVRLNGQLADIFEDWLRKNFPDRADKVWHSIQDCHHGKVNDSDFGHRMHGSGNFAKLIKDTFKLNCNKYGLNKEKLALNSELFIRPGVHQLNLF